jgi:3-oxoadipate enol-lactonase
MSPHVNVRRAGLQAGPKLLMLHGIGSNSQSFQPQLSGLADELDMAAWDAPGYGASEDPPEDFSLGAFADAAVSVLDALGWQSACVLGHSFGGVVAQMLYLRHPDRIQALVLSDTNAGSGSLPEPERSQRIQRRLEDVHDPVELAKRRAPNLVTAEAPPGLVAELIHVMSQVRPPGYAAAAMAMGTADLTTQLSAIRVPTLVLHGECDSVIPPETAARISSSIPNARLVVIPGAGHASNQQRPSEYNAALRAFIGSLP